MTKKIIPIIINITLFLVACNTEEDRLERESQWSASELFEREKFIEDSISSETDRKNREIQFKKDSIEREITEQKEKAEYDKFINKSLETDASPYGYCFGSDNSCNSDECSKISVTTPINSDVLVTIKKNGKVYRHTYIKAGRTFTFYMPNGNYQAFFYYG